MLYQKLSIGRIVSAIAVSGCLLTGISTTALADSNSGLTLFSGVKSENILSYFLDFGGQPNGWDRYRLRIPSKKMELGVSQFVITYPDYYDGKFDQEDIEVRINKDESLPLSEVKWDKDNHRIEIYLEKPIEAGKNVEIVLSNVKNPVFGGTYYFECRAFTPGDIPLPRYLGTWILSIN